MLSYWAMRRTTCTCNGCHTGFPGLVVQSPIKLAQHKRKFWFQFSVRLYSYIARPSVLGLHNLKLNPPHDSRKHFDTRKKWPDFTQTSPDWVEQVQDLTKVTVLKVLSFRKFSHETIRKSSRVIMQDYSW